MKSPGWLPVILVDTIPGETEREIEVELSMVTRHRTDLHIFVKAPSFACDTARDFRAPWLACEHVCFGKLWAFRRRAYHMIIFADFLQPWGITAPPEGGLRATPFPPRLARRPLRRAIASLHTSWRLLAFALSGRGSEYPVNSPLSRAWSHFGFGGWNLKPWFDQPSATR